MKNKSRYFLVSYNWTSNSQNGFGEVTFESINGFFDKEYIKKCSGIKNITGMVILYVYQFNSKADFEEYTESNNKQ